MPEKDIKLHLSLVEFCPLSRDIKAGEVIMTSSAVVVGPRLLHPPPASSQKMYEEFKHLRSVHITDGQL